jgi:hypothetical protein
MYANTPTLLMLGSGPPTSKYEAIHNQMANETSLRQVFVAPASK